MSSTSSQSVTILGSTGSIGVSTLDVISRHRSRYNLHALTARNNVELLAEQCALYRPNFAVVLEPEKASELESRLKALKVTETQVDYGSGALQRVAEDSSVDVVVAAIVGSAGLMPTMAAAKSGKRILLANKEALVMSGQLLMSAARASGGCIVPLDSEHNAIFQCLPSNYTGSEADNSGVIKIFLTASGGPFRGYTKKQLSVVSRQQALRHPNWAMGPKITIDSASLMNKGLEVIEACQLFNLTLDQVEVVVHPESVIHSLVSYSDGSVLAQLGQPDMRTPIAHALAWPNSRISSGVKPLDLFEIGQLNFERPDLDCFPCLDLACQAQRHGGTAPLVLNAANEVAVDQFLEDRVSFLQLPEIVERTLTASNFVTADDLETILNADLDAREIALRIVDQIQA